MTDTTYDNSTELDPRIAARLKRDAKGLVAAVIQQYDTREVLMVGYMNDEALRRTLTTGRVTFWSRSRQEYWRKGDTSGHVQYVKGVSLDCDGDALLVEVDQVGAACHTGSRPMAPDSNIHSLCPKPHPDYHTDYTGFGASPDNRPHRRQFPMWRLEHPSRPKPHPTVRTDCHQPDE